MFSVLLKEHVDEIIRHTQHLIQIPSVEGKPQSDYPFGPEPWRALQYVLELGAAIGFRTRNIDNYAGDIEFGQGAEILGILAHVDVVPEGSGWTYPPFEGRVANGCIYGRGALDDKGPIIATLFAMRAVAESGRLLNKRVRLILGTNEETGSRGIAHYLSVKEAPHLAFTPDADFPLIRGEKGILKVKIKRNWLPTDSNHPFPLTLTGGLSINAVAESCSTRFQADPSLREELTALLVQVDPGENRFRLENDAGELKLCCRGISAHGSTPEAGRNAISDTLCLLNRLSFTHEPLNEFLSFYATRIGMGHNGQGIGLGFADEISGPLTLNVGKIRLDCEGVELAVDIRYPLKTGIADVVEALNNHLGAAGLEIDIYDHLNAIYFRENHPLVRKLMTVYQTVTGDTDSHPLIIGGGTYARALPNAVAFGPLFPGRTDTAHQKDEHIRIDDLMMCAEIYAHAIAELAG